jgi:nitrate reductase delta subunit
MQTDRKLYQTLASLLSYPTGCVYEQAGWLYHQSLKQEAGDIPSVEPFYAFISERRLEEIEETFTKTFDLNPSCCLEVGWHLYGEDYQRGAFLVNMRQSLEEENLEESHELPDHISHCLRLLTCLEPEDAEVFVLKYIHPALAKIMNALEEDNPYRAVIALLRYELERQYGPVDPQHDNDHKLIDLPVLNNVLHYHNREDMDTYKSR